MRRIWQSCAELPLNFGAYDVKSRKTLLEKGGEKHSGPCCCLIRARSKANFNQVYAP